MKYGALEAILPLLLSDHLIMQNEGLIALIITAANYQGIFDYAKKWIKRKMYILYKFRCYIFFMYHSTSFYFSKHWQLTNNFLYSTFYTDCIEEYKTRECIPKIFELLRKPEIQPQTCFNGLTLLQAMLSLSKKFAFEFKI